MSIRESRLRRLTKSIQDSANSLKPYAQKDPSLIPIYNSLCQALDTLNLKLADESAGMLTRTWHELGFRVGIR